MTVFFGATQFHVTGFFCIPFADFFHRFSMNVYAQNKWNDLWFRQNKMWNPSYTFYDIPLTFVGMKQKKSQILLMGAATLHRLPQKNHTPTTFDRYFMNPAHFTSKQPIFIVSLVVLWKCMHTKLYLQKCSFFLLECLPFTVTIIIFMEFFVSSLWFEDFSLVTFKRPSKSLILLSYLMMLIHSIYDSINIWMMIIGLS